MAAATYIETGRDAPPVTRSFITFAVERHTLAFIELHLLKVVHREACSLFFCVEPQKFNPGIDPQKA